MAASNATIGSLRVSLGIDTAEFETGLKQSESRLGKFSSNVSTAVAAAAAGVATAAAGIAVAIKGTLNTFDDMSKAAQKFGVPIDELTRLKYAADLSDVSIETLGTGLRKLAQNMDEAASGGTSRATEAFRMLGVAVENSDGTLRTQTEVMGDVADKLAGMSDGAQKTAISMAIFGKSGAELIPMLNGGRDGLREMAAEAEALGLVIDQRTGTAAENFNDNITRLGKVFDGLMTKVAAGLAPTLESLSQIFVDLARDEVKVDAAITSLTSLFKNVTELAYAATIDVRNFAAETKALFAVATASNWEDMKAAWQGYQGVLEENVQRTREAREKMDAMWLPNASEGLGADYQNAPQSTGGGYDAPSDREQAALDRQAAMAQRKLEFLRESLMTEEEAENASYLRRLEQLNAFHEQGLVSNQEFADLNARIDQDYHDHLARMAEERLNAYASTVGSLGSIISSLSTIMGKEGDKQLGIVKALSLAESLINVYTGITAALRLPFPANMAAAAQVAAQGFAAVAAIKGTNKGSSGGGGGGSLSSGGGGGAPSTEAGGLSDSRSLYVSGINPSQLYSGEALRGLMDAIGNAQRDGYKVVIA